MIIAICGSLKFFKEMLQVQKQLQVLGHKAIVPKSLKLITHHGFTKPRTVSERLKAEARSTAAEEKTIAVQKRIEAWYRPALGIMMVLLLLALSAVAFVWLALRAARKHVSPAPVPVPEPVRLTRAEDILLALRETTGAELERLVDMPLTPDEVGNPVTIKKVKDFLAKREYLRACPATEWPGIMAGSTRNQEVTPQGAERPA